MILTYFLLAFGTLFPIVNPIGAVGPFLAMTSHDSLFHRRRMAARASMVAGGVLLFCAILGSFFFRWFGVTIPALKVAGGILLLLVSIDMINVRQSRSKSTTEEQEEGAAREDIAVFPLAIPLLSGPGSIVSVLMLADRANTVAQHAALCVSIVLTALIVFLILSEANRITAILGKIGLNVLSRLMGLVLASMAVQFMFDGLLMALPGLAGH